MRAHRAFGFWHMVRAAGRAAMLSAACLGIAHAAGTHPGAVLRATLHNGLRVIIVRNRLAPVVTTEVNYLVGSDEAPAGFPGMAHAQEHMMFRGSPGLSAGQLAAITADMGGEFDADTQQSVTQYFFTVPAKDLDVALHVESIRMRGVLDSQALWRKERGAIEQEVARDLSSPTYVFYKRLLRTMFAGTPYAHDALGTKASFDKTTGAMLQRFHQTWYAPNNAILVVVGDVDPDQTLRKIKALFGDLPAKRLPARPSIALQPVAPQTLRLKTDQPYGMAIVSFRMPGYTSPDYPAAEVLADVLGSQRGNLYALVPAGKALFTDFSLDPLKEAGLGFGIAGFPKGADPDALVEEIRRVLADYRDHGVPADLVAAAKRHEVAQAEFEKNSIPGLADAWSQAVAVENQHSPEAAVRAISAVTVADVDRVAHRYLDLDHAITAVLTPQVSGKPIASSGFGGKESFAPREVKRVALPSWAKQDLSRLSIPASTLHPVVSILPNGLKLIVQPESISQTVSVMGHIRNNADLEAPAGQEGVADVLGQLFSYGTTHLGRLAFQKALDDIGAVESAGTGFSLQVLASHFDRGVSLLAANELHPALPQAAFAVVRQQVAATAAGRLESPDYLAERALKKSLFPKQDPTLRQVTPGSVSHLTLRAVRRYYRHVFRPDLTTIVVIGDITPQEARREIEKYFGGWKASGPKPETSLAAVPLNKPSVIHVPDASRVQDKVVLAETLGINRFSPDYYALELGNHVLGGAFYATRLYRDLRENTGLVYYVTSDFDVGKARGVYMVDYGCDPGNVLKARAIVAHNLAQMRATPVSAGELTRAKALLLREIPLSESSVGRIAGGYLSRSDLGLPLDEPVRAARRYVALNAHQVQQAYAKWINPKRLVLLTQGPQPH
ncbi:MAG: pitrilysin family protein [Betaproteobacteria bacterium]|nr:pitrilysin family protein [Betaproteobacteria bacterium]